MTELVTITRTELAQRSNGGADVTLFWVHGSGDDGAVVCVCNRREGSYFEIAIEPYLALDAYYHPFAYRAVSAVDHAHGGLAA